MCVWFLRTNIRACVKLKTSNFNFFISEISNCCDVVKYRSVVGLGSTFFLTFEYTVLGFDVYDSISLSSDPTWDPNPTVDSLYL